MKKTAMRVPGLMFRLIVVGLVALVILTACGSSGSAEDDPPSNVGLSVSSGSFTTTVRANDVTKVPFAETLVVEAVFEEPIYGSAGQTSVFAEASPSAYRIGSRPRRNDRTYTFSLTNRTPGTVEISIYENRDSKPLTFSVQVGGE